MCSLLTGVQTWALPISRPYTVATLHEGAGPERARVERIGLAVDEFGSRERAARDQAPRRLVGDRRTGRDDEVGVARRGGVARADIGIDQGQIMPLAPATVGGRQHALAIVIFRTGDDMEPVVEKMQADGSEEHKAELKSLMRN